MIYAREIEENEHHACDVSVTSDDHLLFSDAFPLHPALRHHRSFLARLSQRLSVSGRSEPSCKSSIASSLINVRVAAHPSSPFPLLPCVPFPLLLPQIQAYLSTLDQKALKKFSISTGRSVLAGDYDLGPQRGIWKLELRTVSESVDRNKTEGWMRHVHLVSVLLNN
jgi:hypothetical protein